MNTVYERVELAMYHDNKEKEMPDNSRERLRQKERNNNAASNVTDGFHRSSNGSLVDLVGGLGWKGTGIVLLVAIIGFVIYSLFFS
ncbi:DUF6366 family protein [Pontibacillus salicampi]|uniref:DUF6366 family protein n=1 Tax=Pontibacillus salicampi TaxID=1449801 RepID=A0ABV6LRN5_9BACI